MNRDLVMALVVGSVLLTAGCRGAETGEAGRDGARATVESEGAGSIQPAADGPVVDGDTPVSSVADGSGDGASLDGAASGAPAGPGAGAGAGMSGPSTGGAAPAAPAGGAEPPSAAPGQTAPDAAAVLRRAEEVYAGVRSMEADFSQNVDVPLLGRSTRSQGKLYHRSPDRFLMRFSQPEGDIVVADGRHLWMYYPSVDARQVMRTTMAAAGGQVDLHREFLSNPTARYNAVLTGTETVGGRSTHVVVLTPRTPSGYRQVRLWIDREDALVRRFEVTEQNESVRTLDLRNIRRNPTLADAIFEFTPPAGAQIFDQ